MTGQALFHWNDIIKLRVEDKLTYNNEDSYNGVKLTIADISTDYDRGGVNRTFTFKISGKFIELTINHLGEAKGHLGKFNLSDGKLKKVISGGKRLLRRNKKSKKHTSRKRRTKKNYY